MDTIDFFLVFMMGALVTLVIVTVRVWSKNKLRRMRREEVKFEAKRRKETIQPVDEWEEIKKSIPSHLGKND
jgi:hypothetical protein